MFTISSGKELWKRRSNVVNDNSYQDIRNKRDKIFKCVAIIHCSYYNSLFCNKHSLTNSKRYPQPQQTSSNNSRKRIRILRFVVPRQSSPIGEKSRNCLKPPRRTNDYSTTNIHRQILQDSANLVEAQQRILEKEFESNYNSLFRNKRLPTNFAEKL